MAQTIERSSPRADRAPRAPVVPKLEYQPGLDGLRALAVVAVILYHAQMNMPSSWMPGGFVGVEVFFVISGYLITLLLISEHLRTQRVDFGQFWLRRARRLLPALFALLVVTMGIVGIGGHFYAPWKEHVKAFRGMWASAWVYATNWYQILAGLNYADKQGRPPLLRHLWSLAVEEQFYLLWPLIMAFVLYRWGRKLPAVGVAFLVVSLGITVATAVAYQPDNVGRANWLYLSTVTRASGLLLGAGLAVFWRPWLVRRSRARHLGVSLDLLALVGLGVLGVIVAKWHFLNEEGDRGYDPLFRGGFLVVGLATVLLILATTHPRSFLGQKVFASKPLVWIGTRSYGLYLWHFPIFQLTRPRGDLTLLGNEPDVNMDWLSSLALRLALTVLVTELSYQLLETPIRNGAIGRTWARMRAGRSETRSRVLVAAMAGVIVVGAVGIGTAAAFHSRDAIEDAQACNRDPEHCVLTEDTTVPTDDTTGAGDTTAPGSSVDAGSDSTAAPGTDEPGTTDGHDTTLASRGTDDPGTSGVPATTAPGTSSSLTQESTVPAAAVKPLAIGDSVMLGAKNQLIDAGFRVDAKESRQFSKAVGLIQYYRSKGQVGDVVVIALGTNGQLTDKLIDKLMEELDDVKHVVFVTPQIAGKTPEATNHSVILAARDRYSNITVVDWQQAAQTKLQYAYTTGGSLKAKDAYFWQDKIHLAPKGQAYYTQLIVDAVVGFG